ncbi:MAG: hypothetical protein WBH50_13450 [Fuerstiella sp.]
MYFSRNTLLAAIFSIGTLVATSSFTVAGGGCSSRGYSRSYSHSYSAPSYGHSYPSHSHGYSLPSQSYAQPTYNYQPQVQVHSVAQAEPLQIQQAPVPGIQQPVQQTPVRVVSQQQQFAQLQPQQQVQPQTTLPVQQQQLQPQTVQPVQQPAVTAQMSALQALGGFAPQQEIQQQPIAPQTAAQPIQHQAPVHVGNWTAKLDNGAQIQLALQTDGTFSWTATNPNGNSSSFSGNYSVDNGQLKLNRSNDDQQLGGTLKIAGTNAFSFQVAGNNAPAISFSRS